MVLTLKKLRQGTHELEAILSYNTRPKQRCKQANKQIFLLNVNKENIWLGPSLSSLLIDLNSHVVFLFVPCYFYL